MPHLRNSRVVPRLIFGPLHVDYQYEVHNSTYRWFRSKENRFKAVGLHGFSGNLLYDAYDRGLKELDKDEFTLAYNRDAAHHTRERFKTLSVQRLKVIGKTS